MLEMAGMTRPPDGFTAQLLPHVLRRLQHSCHLIATTSILQRERNLGPERRFQRWRASIALRGVKGNQKCAKERDCVWI